MIKVRIKHIVIPVIVFLITFITITFNCYVLLLNPTFDIGLLYNGVGVGIQSEEKAVWDALIYTQEKYNQDESHKEYEAINLNSYNKPKVTESQLEEIIYNKEMLYVIGDDYNDVLVNEIAKNKKTKFVLIDNTLPGEFENVIHIDTDETKMAVDAALELGEKSQTKKIIYLTSEPIETQHAQINAFKGAIPEVIVEVVYVKDVNNNVAIISELERLYAIGYDGVYVANSELNHLIVKETKSKQVEINNQFKLENEKNETNHKYQQQRINIITNTFNTYDAGVYEDTNNDQEQGYPDKSVVLESYIKDYNDLIYQITIEAMEYKFTGRRETLPTVKLTDLCASGNQKC